MSYLSIDRDITARKHGNSETSIAAHDKAKLKKSTWWARILDHALSARDFTLEDLCDKFQVEKNVISGRVSELRLSKPPLIVKTGEKRNGFAVYRFDRFA